ncbi:MAG: hypothetical protein LBH66_02720 [Oscillospiraceae bacterium]|jgi:hypothetical protein|nr:hypothetical protein [Oscillospiraceae bacterium]
MKKNIKVASLLMALMLLVSTSAFATSPTLIDLYSLPGVNGQVSDNGSVSGTPDAATAAAAEAELSKASAVAGIAYFSPTVRAQILSFGPVTTIAEIIPVKFGGTFSSGRFQWSFGTNFKLGQPVVIVLGVVSGGAVGWHPVGAKVVKDPFSAYATRVEFTVPQNIYTLSPTLLAVVY